MTASSVLHVGGGASSSAAAIYQSEYVASLFGSYTLICLWYETLTSCFCLRQMKELLGVNMKHANLLDSSRCSRAET